MNESIESRIKKCIAKAKPDLEESNLKKDKHLFYEYGLDSLNYERLAIFLEDEFSIDIDEEERRSGFFSSIEGIEEFLKDYKRIQ